MSELFRTEAIAHQANEPYGVVRMTRPLSFTVLTMLFATMATMLIGFIGFAGYTRKEHVNGVLVPDKGMLRVVAGQTGWIVDRRVNAGGTVKSGDLMFTISTEVASSASNQPKTDVSESLTVQAESLKKEIEQLREITRERANALVSRSERLKRERNQIAEEIKIQTERVSIAESSAARFRELGAEKYASALQIQDRQAEAVDQRARLQALMRAKIGMEGEIDTNLAEQVNLPLAAAREEEAIERSIATVRRELTVHEATRSIEVRATCDGIVTSVNAEVGQSVSGNQVVAAIVPANARMEAELYAPSSAIGFVRVGTTVSLRYNAYPYQKFGQHRGVIRMVERSPTSPSEIREPFSRDGAASEPLYRIRVTLDNESVTAFGREHPLAPGMQIQASLLLEHRRIWEWITQPLYNIGGRV